MSACTVDHVLLPPKVIIVEVLLCFCVLVLEDAGNFSGDVGSFITDMYAIFICVKSKQHVNDDDDDDDDNEDKKQ